MLTFICTNMKTNTKHSGSNAHRKEYGLQKYGRSFWKSSTHVYSITMGAVKLIALHKHTRSSDSNHFQRFTALWLMCSSFTTWLYFKRFSPIIFKFFILQADHAIFILSNSYNDITYENNYLEWLLYDVCIFVLNIFFNKHFMLT